MTAYNKGLHQGYSVTVSGLGLVLVSVVPCAFLISIGFYFQ